VSGAGRLALLAAAVMALFAVVFTAGSALAVWPPLPAGAFYGWDLWSGLAIGLVLLIALVKRKSERRIENPELDGPGSRF
jgi:hypothetical protein